MMEDLNRELEDKMEKSMKLKEENNNRENEINDILEENGILENEIEKLGKKTNEKM